MNEQFEEVRSAIARLYWAAAETTKQANRPRGVSKTAIKTERVCARKLAELCLGRKLTDDESASVDRAIE